MKYSEHTQLEKVSATCIASFSTRARYYVGNGNLAAIYNQFADELNSDKLYQKYFPGCKQPWEMTSFIIAREQIIVQLLEKALYRSQIANIVFLGCGVSPLPLNFAERVARFGNSANVFATDLTIPLKLQENLVKKFLSKAQEREMLSEYPTDFPGVSTIEAIEEKLKFCQLDITNKNQFEKFSSCLLPGPVAFIAEGVFPYFLQKEWDLAVQNIRAILKDIGGFFVTDVATRQGIKYSPFQGDSKNLLQSCYSVAQVSPDALPFNTAEDCCRYLKQNGFQYAWEKLSNPEDFWQKVKLPQLGKEEKARIEKMLSRPSMLRITI